MPRLLKVALVTAGILIVLAILLFPVFQQPAENRRYAATGCMSNMKQLGLALVQYAQASDETLPRKAAADNQGWREAVYPYVKSVGVYRCPDDQRDSSRDSPSHLPKSYAANTVSLGKAELSDPARTIMLVDERGLDGEDWSITDPAFLPDSGRTLYAHLPPHTFYQHPSGTLNLLFADGHVKAMPPMATLMPTNVWTRDNAPFTGPDLVNAQAILKHAESE